MDFATQTYYLQLGIGWIWGISTALTCFPMFLAFTYIVIEWCLQSHLSTVNYEKARRGLRRTRKFRKLVQPIENGLHMINHLVVWIWGKTAPKFIMQPRKSSVQWTKARMPTVKLQMIRTSYDQSESAIDDHLFSAGSNPNETMLGLGPLPSPSRSVNRSPRSSFGQEDMRDVHRPRAFI